MAMKLRFAESPTALTRLLLIALSLIWPSSGLRLVQLHVPSAVRAERPVELKCEFDLEQDNLYSVKWYKNNIEFFRYQPGDHPPGQAFDLQGMYVDVGRSNAKQVYLPKTDVNTEGIYGCEVSTEGPIYSTVKGEKEMRVYALPERNPVIEGLQPTYRVGERVNASCISPPSRPPAKLIWLLNGSEIPQKEVWNQQLTHHSNGLQSSRADLFMVLKKRDVKAGPLSFQCVATIRQTFHRSSLEVFFGDSRRAASRSSEYGGKAPKILSSKTDYDVGDTLEANCTFEGDNQHAVELFWTVNGRPVKSEYLRHYPSRTLHNLHQEIAVLGIEMKLDPSHFPNDELSVRCTATLSNVFERHSEAYAYSGQQGLLKLQLVSHANSLFSSDILLFLLSTCILILGSRLKM